VIKRLEAREDLQEIFGENFTVSDKIDRILEMMAGGKSIKFSELFVTDGVAGRDRGHFSRAARVDPAETVAGASA
jgi:hypothetical protein